MDEIFLVSHSIPRESYSDQGLMPHSFDFMGDMVYVFGYPAQR